jgi:hypothetical protein
MTFMGHIGSYHRTWPKMTYLGHIAEHDRTFALFQFMCYVEHDPTFKPYVLKWLSWVILPNMNQLFFVFSSCATSIWTRWAWWWDVRFCFVGLGSTYKSPASTLLNSTTSTSFGRDGRSRFIISNSCSWLIFYYPPFFFWVEQLLSCGLRP